MPQVKPVTARLEHEVAEHRLENDAAQSAAAARLDALAGALGRRRSRLWALLGAEWSARLAPASAPRGIYLWGGVGRGKTRLMDLFYDSLDFPERERDHFYVLMRTVHAELRGARDRERPLETVAERIAARARVVCLDEFFVSDIADAMILSGLLDGLFRRGVTIVATSNLPPRDLYKDGLQRARFLPAIEMIENRMDVLHLDGGTDYRLRSFERERTYFDSARADAQVQMRRLFHALATGSPAGPATIEVAGRNIAALDRSPGLIWFGFRELCETPRSADDYLELAHRYHTIFLSDVPVFHADAEDAARRFLTLIDALYDRGVNVVVSAAAPPDRLYQGEKLRFEFTRAASRLMEMQSRQYLAAEHRP